MARAQRARAQAGATKKTALQLLREQYAELEDRATQEHERHIEAVQRAEAAEARNKTLHRWIAEAERWRIVVVTTQAINKALAADDMETVTALFNTLTLVAMSLPDAGDRAQLERDAEIYRSGVVPPDEVLAKLQAHLVVAHKRIVALERDMKLIYDLAAQPADDPELRDVLCEVYAHAKAALNPPDDTAQASAQPGQAHTHEQEKE